jgi:hypothetical protein
MASGKRQMFVIKRKIRTSFEHEPLCTSIEWWAGTDKHGTKWSSFRHEAIEIRPEVVDNCFTELCYKNGDDRRVLETFKEEA